MGTRRGPATAEPGLSALSRAQEEILKAEARPHTSKASGDAAQATLLPPHPSHLLRTAGRTSLPKLACQRTENGERVRRRAGGCGLQRPQKPGGPLTLRTSGPSSENQRRLQRSDAVEWQSVSYKHQVSSSTQNRDADAGEVEIRKQKKEKNTFPRHKLSIHSSLKS